MLHGVLVISSLLFYFFNASPKVFSRNHLSLSHCLFPFRCPLASLSQSQSYVAFRLG